MISIFISRTFSENSFFQQEILGSRLFKVHAESLIEFTFVPFQHIPYCDWIFFYSPRAVQFYAHGLNEMERKLPAFIRIAAMGPGTASAVFQQKWTIDFIGNGNPKHTAEAFQESAFETTVLFPRAKHSKKSIQSQLDDTIETVDLVVYDNQIKATFDIPTSDLLIFTSPMNVEAYFSRYAYRKGQEIVAIGPTTRSKLVGLGFSNILMPSEPTEAGLVNLVKTAYQ